MVTEKTIKAFADAGIDYSRWHEKGYEIGLRQQKELTKNQDKTEVIGQVYRVRVSSSPPNTRVSEVILYDRTTYTSTPLGNPVTYWEGPEDNGCIWYSVLPTKITRFDSQSEENQVIIDPQDLHIVTNYEYEFNESNIKMIEKLTKNNKQYVSWQVRDNTTGFTRACLGFDDWAKKPFDELLALDKQFSKDALERQQSRRLDQQYH